MGNDDYRSSSASLDWLVWMMVMWVLVFGEGVVMVYCMEGCGWEVDINCSKEE